MSRPAFPPRRNLAPAKLRGQCRLWGILARSPHGIGASILSWQRRAESGGRGHLLGQRFLHDRVEALGLLNVWEVTAVIDDMDTEALSAKVRSIPDEATVLLPEDRDRAHPCGERRNIDCAERRPHKWPGTLRIKALRHRQDRTYFLHFVTVSNIVLQGKFSPVGILPQARGDLHGPNRPRTR